MKKHRLNIDYEYDFFLTGISCHEKPYRLCWAINKILETELQLIDPLSIDLKKNDSPMEFQVFKEKNKDRDTSLYLIANKNENNFLIPEHHQADFFFIAKGPFNSADFDAMLNSIKEISFVLMSYRIDPQTLKSKDNLLF